MTDGNLANVVILLFWFYIMAYIFVIGLCLNKDLSDDFYFVPNDVGIPLDLCVYKDDDFRFIFEIDDQSKEAVVDENAPVTPEIIYQDEQYTYQFDSPKSSYIFITTPEVRGKPASRIPLMNVLNQNLLTIDELIEKGLDVKKVEKNTEVSE